MFRIAGVGPGSFMWCSLLIDKFKEPMFLQMHSDWLQLAFEEGIVGILLVIATVLIAVKRALSNKRVLMGIAGASVFALTYHPLRFFPSAIMLALIFSEALVIQKVEIENA